MNKNQVLQQLQVLLETTYQGAVDAAQRAHETATSDENVAENKYDTLALEAAYLAQGQSLRVEQCKADIDAFNMLALKITEMAPRETVELGCLVLLFDQQDQQKWLFLGPAAGGLKVQIGVKEVIVVTAESPLGRAILGKQVDDEVSVVIADKQHHYEIIELY